MNKKREAGIEIIGLLEMKRGRFSLFIDSLFNDCTSFTILS
jgi:hypothetical protein